MEYKEAIRYLKIKSIEAEPGDEFYYTFGRKPNRDWDKARAVVVSVNRATRSAIIERKDEPRTQLEIPLCGTKTLFGGPKLALANSNRNLIRKGGYGYWWAGEATG